MSRDLDAPRGERTAASESLMARLGAAATQDATAVQQVIREELLGDAYRNLSDGLRYRNAYGKPDGRYARLFFELAGLVQVKHEIAQIVLNLIGAPVEEARLAVEQRRGVADLDHHQLARRAIRGLRSYQLAHPAEFRQACIDEALFIPQEVAPQ